MKDPLFSTLHTFLHTHWVSGRPLLLAYSGGPDSKVLLHLLVKCKRLIPIDLHLAHADHAWRPESYREAELLRQESEELGLPFHLHRSTTESLSSNREATARETRFAFLKKVYEKIGAQAVLLGHHADDQAETVLKRLFEGAHLRHLGGMTPVGNYAEMVLWRPLLAHSKQELGAWLQQKDMGGIHDSTNTDPRFLRGRMRQNLLPLLSQEFGKAISRNLRRLGESSQELSAYFSRRLSPHFLELRESPFGSHWDLSSLHLDKVEWEYLLKEGFQRQNMKGYSHEMLQEILSCLQKKKADRQFPCKAGTLFADRGHLFWVKTPLPLFQGVWPVQEGELLLEQGPWRWEGTVQAATHPLAPSSWRDFYTTGEITVSLPEGEYLFCSPEDPELRKKFQQKWQEARVPSFLRRAVPLVVARGPLGITHEFLSGRFNFNNNSKSFKFISLKIKYMY